MPLGFVITGPTKIQVAFPGQGYVDLGYSERGFSIGLRYVFHDYPSDNTGGIAAVRNYRGVTADIRGILVKYDEVQLEPIINLKASATAGRFPNMGLKTWDNVALKVKLLPILAAKKGYEFPFCLIGSVLEINQVGSLEKVVAITFSAFTSVVGGNADTLYVVVNT